MRAVPRPRRLVSEAVFLAMFAAGGPQCAREGCVEQPDETPPGIDLDLVQAANNRDFLPRALELVGGASERVHLVEYVVYDSGPVHELLLALADAAARGVDVAVLADEEAAETQEALSWLEEQGVRTRLDSPAVTTHNKLIVADDAVLLGSHNLSTNALYVNNEASISVAVPAIADWYDAYFAALWEDSETDPSIEKPATDPIVPIKNREIVAALESCLVSADSRIRLVLYAASWRDDYPDSDSNRLVQRLVEARQRGIDLRVVLDQSDWIVQQEINDRAIEVLLAADVAVRFPPPSVVTHAKMLSCDDTVIVSDENWAYSGFSLYNGTSLQVTGAAVREQYDAWFESIWESSVPAAR